MSMKQPGAIGRLILTVALLVMVYRETGPWTTFALALSAVAAEINAALMTELRRRR